MRPTADSVADSLLKQLAPDHGLAVLFVAAAALLGSRGGLGEHPVVDSTHE